MVKRLIFVSGAIFLALLAGCTQNRVDTCSYSKIEVYFYYSPGCPHCENVKPYIDELRKSYTNVTFIYCNVQNLSNVCYSYKYYVMGVPTVVVHAGNVTTALIGERDVKSLGDLLGRLTCCGS